MDDWRICLLKSKRGWGYDQARLGYSDEAKRRGLDCQSVGFNDRYASFSDQFLCSTTQKKTKPSGDFLEGVYDEVLKRGLKCGVGETNTSSTASPSSASTINNSIASDNARKAFLGVLVYDVTPDIATDFGLSKSEGAVIAAFAETSPAKLAGLKPGDVVLKLDDTLIKTAQELSGLLSKRNAGEQIEIEFSRFGKID